MKARGLRLDHQSVTQRAKNKNNVGHTVDLSHAEEKHFVNCFPVCANSTSAELGPRATIVRMCFDVKGFSGAQDSDRHLGLTSFALEFA